MLLTGSRLSSVPFTSSHSRAYSMGAEDSVYGYKPVGA